MTGAGRISVATSGSSIVAGVAGGLVGGVVFGLLMQMMGMLPMVARLAGSELVIVGWVVHLLIATFIGITFAVLLGGFATSFASATALGVAYGALWWVLGGLAAMPAILGMPTFTLSDAAWQSLMGHLMYGALLGATYGLVRRR